MACPEPVLPRLQRFQDAAEVAAVLLESLTFSLRTKLLQNAFYWDFGFAEAGFMWRHIEVRLEEQEIAPFSARTLERFWVPHLAASLAQTFGMAEVRLGLFRGSLIAITLIPCLCQQRHLPQ